MVSTERKFRGIFMELLSLFLASGDVTTIDKLNNSMKMPLNLRSVETMVSLVFLTKFFRKFRKTLKNEKSRTNLIEEKVDIFQLSD
jgi:hypothetical protein